MPQSGDEFILENLGNDYGRVWLRLKGRKS